MLKTLFFIIMGRSFELDMMKKLLKYYSAEQFQLAIN